jgi:hypothetical protein
MKKLSILLLIVLAVVLAWTSGIFSTSNTNLRELPAERTVPEPLSEKTLDAFASSTIETRCPFYKPNGNEYRDCLSSWVDELESNLLVEQLEEVQNYCGAFAKGIADENSNEGVELFLKCEIYTLR